MATLTNKTALVTGASRGIGRGAARAIAREGARVFVHYGQSQGDADSLVSEIRGAGGRAESLGANLETGDGAHLLAEKIRKLADEKLDILICNAGISKSTPIDQLTPQDFDRLFAVNVRAPYFLIQQLLPTIPDGGSITLVSSASARTAVPNLAAYAATKGAIDTLTKHFAAALGPRGIRVNAIAPGVIDTDMSSFTHSEAGRKIVLSIQALQRIATPDDVSEVFAFLASDAARWITGQVLAVDGGSKL